MKDIALYKEYGNFISILFEQDGRKIAEEILRNLESYTSSLYSQKEQLSMDYDGSQSVLNVEKKKSKKSIKWLRKAGIAIDDTSVDKVSELVVAQESLKKNIDMIYKELFILLDSESSLRYLLTSMDVYDLKKGGRLSIVVPLRRNLIGRFTAQERYVITMIAAEEKIKGFTWNHKNAIISDLKKSWIIEGMNGQYEINNQIFPFLKEFLLQFAVNKKKVV